MASSGSTDVLGAVRRLFEEPRFQDVHFRCLDDRVVSSNRAFLAARCEYFERLLFGNLMEASCSEIRLQASSEAVRHVLVHLHTGGFGSIEQEACWITLMEASSLAQQYMLPGMVQHVADRLSADLRPENLGLALSYALKADLQAVLKSIWVALPRLLQRPFAVDRSFSADAICFCLKHTAWMAPLAASGTSTACGGAGAAGSSASTTGAAAAANALAAAAGAAAAQAHNAAAAAAAAAAPAGEPNGTAMRRASSTNGASAGSGSSSLQHAEGAVVSSRCVAGSKADSSMAQEAQAFAAVVSWMLQEVAGCADCACTRHELRGACGGSCPASPMHIHHQQQQQQHLLPAGPGFGAASSRSPTLQYQPGRPPLAAGAYGSSSSVNGSGSRVAAGMARSSSATPSLGEAGQPQHPAMQPMLGGSRSSSRQQVQQPEGPARAPGTSAAALLARRLSSRGSVASSVDSDAGEGAAGGADAAQLLVDATGVYAVLTVTPPALSPVAAPGGGAAAAGPSRSSSNAAARLASPAAAAAAAAAAASAGEEGVAPEAAAAAAGEPEQGAAAGAASKVQQQQQEHEVRYSGCCCMAHEAMLLQMLAHLNWHLLEPSVLERLDSLALLGPAAMLELYKAHQRCTHMALWGNFPSLSLGSERGLRCFSSGGEQVLECESMSHLTAAASLCFTSGKHCWQFVVAVPCDLVWLGISDGSLQPGVWGGKQPGGWFYGSNDALCHNKQSDRHAYTKHCGNGKWGEGAVVDVCLDMDAREVWFGLDGSEPKLGFTELPDRVYPAVSLRAPAQLLVRFRAASWLTAEWTRAGGPAAAAAAAGGSGSA